MKPLKNNPGALIIFYAWAALALTGCRKVPRTESAPQSVHHGQKGTMMQEQKPVGNATMTSDGTLILDLRAEGPRGEIGMSRIAYPPSDPNYQMVLKHLGGIKPGEQKLVPPFPDE